MKKLLIILVLCTALVLSACGSSSNNEGGGGGGAGGSFWGGETSIAESDSAEEPAPGESETEAPPEETSPEEEVPPEESTPEQAVPVFPTPGETDESEPEESEPEETETEPGESEPEETSAVTPQPEDETQPLIPEEIRGQLSDEDLAIIDAKGYLTHHDTVTDDQLLWNFDRSSGTLTIRGRGPMKDYSEEDPAPWAEYFSDLTKVVIEDSVTTVGDYAFCGADALTTVELTNTIEYIGRSAFCDAVKLERIPFPTGLEEIAANAFRRTRIGRELTIPEGVQILGAGAFGTGFYYDTITLPASLYYVAEQAFVSCHGVRSFIVAEDNDFLTAVDGVLYNKAMTVLLQYPSLKEDADFTVPDTVTHIAGRAFDLTYFLRTLTIPASVDNVEGLEFGLMWGFEKITVDDGNPMLVVKDGVLYSKDGKILYLYPQQKADAEYTVPDGVEKISYRAFGGAQYLQKVMLPKGVRIIGKEAFFKMNGAEIHLPAELTETLEMIGEEAFVNIKEKLPDATKGFTWQEDASLARKNGSAIVFETYLSEPVKIVFAGTQDDWNEFTDRVEVELGGTTVVCEGA